MSEKKTKNYICGNDINIKSMQATQVSPELNEFFKKLYELKNYIKKRASEVIDEDEEDELLNIWNRLDAIFLPNDKKPVGENNE